jgi:hypothetical protein
MVAVDRKTALIAVPTTPQMLEQTSARLNYDFEI